MSTTTIEKPIRVVQIVLAKVGDRMGVTPKGILSPDRRKHVMLARHVAMWILRGETVQGRFSTNWIGAQMQRDHSTVLHALQKMEVRRAEDQAFREMTDTLRSDTAAFLRMREAHIAEKQNRAPYDAAERMA